MTRKNPAATGNKSGRPKPKLKKKTVRDLDPTTSSGKRVKGGYPKPPRPNPATFGYTCFCPDTTACPVPLPYPNKG